MKINFLGTGVCVARKERASPGILIQAGKDNLLFDIGPGTVKTLVGLGCDVSRLKYLFITHFHIDHVNDYAALVKDRKFTTEKQLNVYGPEGLKKFGDVLFNQAFPYMGKELNVFEFLRLKEVSEGLVEQNKDWKVSCAPVTHYGSIAYRIDSKGRSVLYSGDTAPSDGLVKLGKNVDVAILECSYPDEKALKGSHLVPATAGKLAQEMKAKKLYLTHLYPACEGREHEMIEEVKRHFDGEVFIAEDSMKVKV